MFESEIEKTIIGTALVLWFAHGFYLNDRLKVVHKKLDKSLDAFDGLRDYLYEIDPQFDDERESLRNFNDGKDLFAGMNDIKLTRLKEKAGKRTLNAKFTD